MVYPGAGSRRRMPLWTGGFWRIFVEACRSESASVGIGWGQGSRSNWRLPVLRDGAASPVPPSAPGIVPLAFRPVFGWRQQEPRHGRDAQAEGDRQEQRGPQGGEVGYEPDERRAEREGRVA